MQELHERLQNVFRDVFDDSDLVIEPAMTASFIKGWDSIAHINLMFAIEQTFNVRFHGDEFSDVENVGTLETLLKSKLHH